MNENENSELLQLACFTIGQEEFGIDILKVHEIIRLINITKVPNSPEFVDGIINLRGRVIPVINLRNRLGLQRIDNDKNTRIIVVDLNGSSIGFIVDEVHEVLRIPRSITEPPPPMVVTGIDSDFITAVGRLEDRLLILLDLDKILNTMEQKEVSGLIK